MLNNKQTNRTPIYLNHQALALLQIFKKDTYIEDLWLFDTEQHYEDEWKKPEYAAHQFIEQLEGEENIIFLKALRNEIDKELLKHDKIYGTNFSKE